MQVPATFGFRDPLSAHDAALVNVTCRARFFPDIAGMHTPGLLAGGAGSTHAEFSEGYSGNATLFVKAGLAGQIEVTVWGDYAYLRPTEGDNPANLIPSPLPGDGPGPGDLPNINSGGGIPKMVTGQIRFGATIGFGVGPYGQTFFSDMSLQNDDRDDISGRILSLAPRPLPLGATLTFSPRFTYSGPGQAMDMQPITYLLIIRVTDVKTQPRPPRPSPPPTPQPRPVPAPLVPTLLMQKVYFLFNQSDHLDRANNNTGFRTRSTSCWRCRTSWIRSCSSMEQRRSGMLAFTGMPVPRERENITSIYRERGPTTSPTSSAACIIPRSPTTGSRRTVNRNSPTPKRTIRKTVGSTFG